MNKLGITIFLIILPYFIQGQSKMSLKIGYDRLIFDVNGEIFYSNGYNLAYIYKNKEKNSLIDVRNYFNVEVGWNYKRLFLNTGLYVFKDVFEIKGRKTIIQHGTVPRLRHVFTLNYKENRLILGGYLNLGINMLPVDLNSELIISIGAYFDKSIFHKVEEDYVFKRYNYNHITDESSSTEESDVESEGIEIFRGVRFRTFLNATYNYHFMDNWVVGINIGFNPNRELTRQYFNSYQKAIIPSGYEFFMGLKIGFTFPVKEK